MHSLRKFLLPSQDSYFQYGFLAGFLMLWLKQCVMLTLLHEVIVADVVYPAILLAFGRNIALLLAMVRCIQSGLRVLTKMFCKVEALVDDEGNMLIDHNGEPEVKVPNPRVELSCAYFMGMCIVHP